MELVLSLPSNLQVNEVLSHTLDRYFVGGKTILLIKGFETQSSEFNVDKYNHEATGKDHLYQF